MLLGQPERFPAGGEHPHAGAVCAQRAHGAGRFLEQVLAVIEDEQPRRGSQRLGCGVQGGEAQGVGDREGDDLGLGDRGELAQRDVAVPLAGGGARRSRLAHAAHPGQRHDRADLEQARHLAELGLAAMEGRSRSAQQLAGNLRRRRQGVGHRAPGRPGHRHRWHRRRRRDGLLLLEDRTLQARELRTRVEAGLVGEAGTVGAQDGQGLQAAAGPGERGGQLQVRSLAERLGPRRVFGVGKDLVMVSRRQLGVEELRAHRVLQRVEADAVGGQPAGFEAGQVDEVGETGPAPARQRVAQQAGRLGGRGTARHPSPPQELLGPVEVELAGLDDEPVPTWFAEQPRTDDAEGGPQPGDVRVEPAARPGRGVVPPQHIDEPLGADPVALGAEQQREYGAWPGAAEGDHAPTVPDLDGPEHAELDGHAGIPTSRLGSS